MQIRISGCGREIYENSKVYKKNIKKNKEEILFGFLFGSEK